MSFVNKILASQMTKDANRAVNVAGQERREAWSATRSLQKIRAPQMLNEDPYECDTIVSDASNHHNARSQEIDTLTKATHILKNSIFVLMTLLSLSILVKEGSVCISK